MYFLDWRGDAILIGWRGSLGVEDSLCVSNCVFDASNSNQGTRQAISIIASKTDNLKIGKCLFKKLRKIRYAWCY